MAQHLKWILLSVFVQFVSGQDEKKAVGGDITFYPESISSPTKSIIWKHRDTAGTVVKAIEWNNEDGVEVLNPKFKGITTLNLTSGGVTITNLKFEHTGVYSIEINSKEQAKKFPLTVIERVPKPKIRREPTGNRDVMYLICEGDARIIWKNSTGETLSGTPISSPPKGESLTVKNTHNRDNYYTCTLKNEVSEETSDPDYEKDLFADHRGSALGIVLGLVMCALVLTVPPMLYIFNTKTHGCIKQSCGNTPIIGNALNGLDSCGNKIKGRSAENPGGDVEVPKTSDEKNKLKSPENSLLNVAEDNQDKNADLESQQ